ncbi:hypothetical protein FVER14953_20766 [Fusarium verticillioides]|nr:hypothetical protein FVER14953_20766 [Fusarium verticillioides]
MSTLSNVSRPREEVQDNGNDGDGDSNGVGNGDGEGDGSGDGASSNNNDSEENGNEPPNEADERPRPSRYSLWASGFKGCFTSCCRACMCRR